MRRCIRMTNDCTDLALNTVNYRNGNVANAGQENARHGCYAGNVAFPYCSTCWCPVLIVAIFSTEIFYNISLPLWWSATTANKRLCIVIVVTEVKNYAYRPNYGIVLLHFILRDLHDVRVAIQLLCLISLISYSTNYHKHTRAEIDIYACNLSVQRPMRDES